MAPRTTGRRTTAKKAPARRRPPARRAPKPTFPVLEQRHQDLIGLVLVALAVFAGFVLWLGWDGGAIGDGLVDAMRWAVGAMHLAAPVVFMAAVAFLVLKPQ